MTYQNREPAAVEVACDRGASPPCHQLRGVLLELRRRLFDSFGFSGGSTSPIRVCLAASL